MIDLHIVCLNGEGCKPSLHPSTLGQEVRITFQQRKGPDLHSTTLLHRWCSAKVCKSRALQGLRDPFCDLCSNRSVCCMVLRPWKSGTGGRARIGGSDTNGRDNPRWVLAPPQLKLRTCFQPEPGRSHLSKLLAKLDLRTSFQSEPGKESPCHRSSKLDLRTWFHQSLEGVIFPRRLTHLTVGMMLKQSLEGLTLPSSLQGLIFGHDQ